MGGPRHRGHGRTLKDLKREINARNGGDSTNKNNVRHTPAEVVDGNGVPYTIGQVQSAEPWTPSPYTAFKVLLSARLGAAVWSGISDCDETFNYWEPAHHLLYGQGLQTWEYDPKFALRSYLYILAHAIPGWVYAKLVQPNPMLVFYFLRCLFGFICALCEVYFYRGVLCEFGANVGRLCLALLVFSAGMFVSSTAFLPSTTSMYLTLLSIGAWFHQQNKLAIFFTALSTFLSWPFAALIGLPIAVDILFFKKQWRLFIHWCLISAVTILGPQLLCDSYYYGRPVFASFNIVWYNVFTSHGPDLYGTEPAQYYLINGILNFNFVFILALMVLPVQIAARYMLKSELKSSGFFLSDTMSQSPLYLWLLVFWTRPHKEERFLFPIYPLVCLAGAMVIDSCQKLYYYFFVKIKSRHFLHHTTWLGVLTITLSAVISLSRMTALYQGYHGVTDIWMRVNQLPDFSTSTTVCVGKEWYRYQSSFFLPSTSFKIAFLKSEFSGQLPKYYARPDHNNPGILSTQISHPDFNDLNMEEKSRYIAHAGKCHFLVDLEDNTVSEFQPSYVSHGNWTIEAEFEFLNPSSSHPLFRAFYIPFLSRQFTKYNRYLLLRRVSPRRLVPSED